MKYLSLTLIIFLTSIVFISCREPSRKEATQDVVEDIDDLMQKAEDDVTEMVNKDSSDTEKDKIRKEDTIPIQDNIKSKLNSNHKTKTK